MDPRLAALFANQHGAATIGQALGAGFRRGQVEGWVRRGRVRSPATGILVAPGATATPEFEAMVAVLRCGEGARLIGPRVLGLLGVRGFARSDPFGVLLTPNRDPRARPDLAAFRDPAPDDGTVRADRIPIPTPARCVIEMSRWLEGVALRSAVDAALWARRPSREDLLERISALPVPYAPAARMRELVRAGHLDQESEPERRLAEILEREFGRVEFQVWVSPRRRVDLLVRSRSLVIEYDGADHRTEAGRDRDEVRDGELEELGYRVAHVHHEDLASPRALLARIGRVLAGGADPALRPNPAPARDLDEPRGLHNARQARASTAAARKIRAR